MAGFKTTLMTCQRCGRKIMVRGTDMEQGQITCSHVGCGAINSLQTTFQYDQSLALSLPAYGQLTYLNAESVVLPIRFGDNILGTDASCDVRLERYQHEGHCYISRRHCLLTVSFDKWLGTLRYQLQDGSIDPTTKSLKTSLNGTYLNDVMLQKIEHIDMADGDVITLGGIDRFRLSPYVIDPAMRETYQVTVPHSLDQTQ